jgi:hypothetical protein
LKVNNCPVATEYVEKREKNYGPNRRLLFLLDSATVNMLCGNYVVSNDYFHRAEDLAEELWTRSVSREAASFLVNDYTIPYSGEDFERALINLFSAINYAVMGKNEDALVECRRLDANLSVFNQKYENKSVYKEDAFGRYLSGIIYEAADDLNDAYIDYFKAYQAFRDYKRDYGTPVPLILEEDLVRTAEATQRSNELRSLIDVAVGVPSYQDSRKLGKVVIIHFTGTGPVKEEEKLSIPIERGTIPLAFPRFRVLPPSCRDGEVIAESVSQIEHSGSVLVEDINRIAVKDLNDRRGRVVAKVIGRAVVKQVAIDAATKDIKDKNERDMAKVFLNLMSSALEKADTRSWRTLPGEIYLSRMFLPEGKYSIYAKPCGREKVLIDSILIKPGETKFLLFSTM